MSVEKSLRIDDAEGKKNPSFTLEKGMQQVRLTLIIYKSIRGELLTDTLLNVDMLGASLLVKTYLFQISKSVFTQSVSNYLGFYF